MDCQQITFSTWVWPCHDHRYVMLSTLSEWLTHQITSKNLIGQRINQLRHGKWVSKLHTCRAEPTVSLPKMQCMLNALKSSLIDASNEWRCRRIYGNIQLPNSTVEPCGTRSKDVWFMSDSCLIHEWYETEHRQAPWLIHAQWFRADWLWQWSGSGQIGRGLVMVGHLFTSTVSTHHARTEQVVVVIKLSFVTSFRPMFVCGKRETCRKRQIHSRWEKATATVSDSWSSKDFQRKIWHNQAKSTWRHACDLPLQPCAWL
jgi:hypothetical protein